MKEDIMRMCEFLEIKRDNNLNEFESLQTYKTI